MKWKMKLLLFEISNLNKFEVNNTNDKHVAVNLLWKTPIKLENHVGVLFAKNYCNACRREFFIRLIPMQVARYLM